MKSFKAFIAAIVLLSSIACTNQEEAVTFFIENQLTEELIIQNSDIESEAASNIQRQITLDLRSSDSFDTYINRLRDVKIKSFKLIYSDYQGQIQNGKMFVDNVYLCDFQSSMDYMYIQDAEIIKKIEDLLLEQTTARFSFEGESHTNHFLSVQVEVMLEGTFVH